MTGIISHDDDDPMTSSVTAPFKNRIDRERFIAIQQRSAVKRAIRPVTARKLATPPEEHSLTVRNGLSGGHVAVVALEAFCCPVQNVSRNKRRSQRVVRALPTDRRSR